LCRGSNGMAAERSARRRCGEAPAGCRRHGGAGGPRLGRRPRRIQREPLRRSPDVCSPNLRSPNFRSPNLRSPDVGCGRFAPGSLRSPLDGPPRGISCGCASGGLGRSSRGGNCSAGLCSRPGPPRSDLPCSRFISSSRSGPCSVRRSMDGSFPRRASRRRTTEPLRGACQIGCREAARPPRVACRRFRRGDVRARSPGDSHRRPGSLRAP